jgi:hypothetical protein
MEFFPWAFGALGISCEIAIVFLLGYTKHFSHDNL